MNDVIGQAELLAHDPHLVLEELPQRLDELQAHPLRQAADVVMALDRGRRALEGDALDHVGIEGALGEKSASPDRSCLFLEDLDEDASDDLAFSLRVLHPLQGGKEPVLRVHVLEVEMETVLEKVEHLLPRSSAGRRC